MSCSIWFEKESENHDEMSSIGRKEIVMFFYLYAIVEALALFLDSAVIPTSSSVYPVRHGSNNLLWDSRY